MSIVMRKRLAGTDGRWLAPALLIGGLTLGVAHPVFAADISQMTLAFENALRQGQRQLTDGEQGSLVMAAVAYAPELAANPRIAGTDEAIAINGETGYYGGVYFGPIPVDNRRVDYLKLTVWGNQELGWTFDHPTRHIAVQPEQHPTWLWLKEPITERQAMAAITDLRTLATARTGEAATLTPDELDRIHYFDQYFETSFDAPRGSESQPWYANHFIISAYSQRPSAPRREYSAVALFAIVGEELRFIEVRRPN